MIFATPSTHVGNNDLDHKVVYQLRRRESINYNYPRSPQLQRQSQSHLGIPSFFYQNKDIIWDEKPFTFDASFDDWVNININRQNEIINEVQRGSLPKDLMKPILKKLKPTWMYETETIVQSYHHKLIGYRYLVNL